MRTSELSFLLSFLLLAVMSTHAQVVKYECVRCSSLIGPIIFDWSGETKPKMCAACQSKGPFTLSTEHTVYNNFQKITIQESPGMMR